MNTLKDDNVVINLKLLKRFRAYQLLDPSGRKIFGWKVHQFCFIAYFVMVQCSIVYGNLGSLFENEDIVYKPDYYLHIFTNINIELSLMRFIVYMYNAIKIMDLFNVTRYDFFTSKQCITFKKILNNCGEKNRKFTDRYSLLLIFVTAQWFIFPIANNMFTTKSSGERSQNILNLNFNVSTHTYNQYFVIFYLMEVNIGLCVMYTLIIADLLLISFCSAIISQQKLLIRSFKNFGHEDKPQSNFFEEFKSILHDMVQLNIKIKSLFLVVRPIVLLTVSCDSASIILLTYRFIVVYMKMEPDMVLTLFKLGSTVTYVSVKLYIYCNIFNDMNIHRELVNFSIYSCNWTQMDLKFKKLVLLAMRMNDANHLVIKASPKKIVDLQMFASIMSMSYNIVSVMLKKPYEKNDISE